MKFRTYTHLSARNAYFIGRDAAIRMGAESGDTLEIIAKEFNEIYPL